MWSVNGDNVGFNTHVCMVGMKQNTTFVVDVSSFDEVHVVMPYVFKPTLLNPYTAGG